MILDPSKKRKSVLISQAAIMTALVAVTTLLIQVPIPATKGYLDFGDIMIFVSALTFGPAIGGFAGGVGSAISDTLSGYPQYAPFTLVIKGAEGLIAGIIAVKLLRESKGGNVAAVAAGGTVMVVGYFLAEFYPLSLGWAAAAEVPFNILQIAVGGTVGIPVAILLLKRLPTSWKNQPEKQNTQSVPTA